MKMQWSENELNIVAHGQNITLPHGILSSLNLEKITLPHGINLYQTLKCPLNNSISRPTILQQPTTCIENGKGQVKVIWERIAYQMLKIEHWSHDANYISNNT